jgi:hypothetical protein
LQTGYRDYPVRFRGKTPKQRGDALLCEEDGIFNFVSRLKLGPFSMELMVMSDALVKEVSSIKFEILNKQRRSLKITVVGQTASNGWEKPSLELKAPHDAPYDGIYEFDFKGQAPEALLNDMLQSLVAVYTWKNHPKDLRGVRIIAEGNSILKML